MFQTAETWKKSFCLPQWQEITYSLVSLIKSSIQSSQSLICAHIPPAGSIHVSVLLIIGKTILVFRISTQAVGMIILAWCFTGQAPV